MNTEKHITPETAPEYKTQKAIRLYVLWARNRKTLDFVGTYREAADMADELNRDSVDVCDRYHVSSTGNKRANEDMLAEWCIYALKALKARKPGRSAWKRGIDAYSLEILEPCFSAIGESDCFRLPYVDSPDSLEKWLMNGAESWEQYSNGACALVSTWEIAERLFPPSQRKRANCWKAMEAQERALKQAAARLRRIFREFTRERAANN